MRGGKEVCNGSPLRRYAPAGLPSQSPSVTAPPKGEPLAGRASSHWTLKARYGAKGRALLQRAGPSSYNLSVSLRSPAPLVGEPLAGRFTSYWTPEARYGAKGRASLQRAAASGQAHLVKLPLAWTAEHYRFRDIVLCSSRRNLTDMPRAPPLGATATTAASGGNREELLGPRPAGCEARTKGRSRRWEPQPGLGGRKPD